MPYYHVLIAFDDKSRADIIEFNLSKQDLLKNIARPVNKGKSFACQNDFISPFDISEIRIIKTEGHVYTDVPEIGRHWTYADKWRFIKRRRNISKSFIKSLPKKKKAVSRITKKGVISRNIFIVHGRNHKPMKELKAILEEFSLNPIVLHEQPSGSRTIVEKLEKYSGDIGYAFVILTPDDVGTERESFIKSTTTSIDNTESVLSKILMGTRVRARQNVVLEFGYFIGKLNRDRVCCLYKGNVELPSDMHGIVYIPFKESVNEVRDKIVKELKAAGYKLKI